MRSRCRRTAPRRRRAAGRAGPPGKPATPTPDQLRGEGSCVVETGERVGRPRAKSHQFVLILTGQDLLASRYELLLVITPHEVCRVQHQLSGMAAQLGIL